MNLPKVFENTGGFSKEVVILYKKRDRGALEALLKEYSRITKTPAEHFPLIWLYRVNKMNEVVTKGCIRPKDQGGKYSVCVRRVDGFVYQCVFETAISNAIQFFIEMESSV